MTTTTQKLTGKDAREHLEVQLAEHLARHPETQSPHKWMKRVDVAGLGIVVAAFAYALYGSFAWVNTNPAMIASAWFAYAASISLTAALFGLHAILIRAYPPVILPGKPQKFVSGSMASWIGAAFMVGGLIMAALCASSAYATATFNLAMIEPLMNVFGILVSVGIGLSIVYSIYQKLVQAR